MRKKTENDGPRTQEKGKNLVRRKEYDLEGEIHVK